MKRFLQSFLAVYLQKGVTSTKIQKIFLQYFHLSYANFDVYP